MYILMIIAASILFSIGLVTFIGVTTTKQIKSVLGVFDGVKNGEYSNRAQVTSTDELGTIAFSLNEVLNEVEDLIQSREEKDRTQRSIIKLLEDVSDVAEGDLTQEVEVTAEITGAIADSFNYMIAELRRIIGDVQSTTLRINTSAEEVRATMRNLGRGSEDQASKIMDVTVSVDEMADSIKRVSENASTSASVAEKALGTAKEGTEAVQNTIRGMENIREQVQETSKRIKRLGESSQEIGEIVQLIGDIADRTSILALNASIQAAMAGEAGQGFSVVAEEIERLGERATESTKRIDTLIRTIQAEMNEAVAAMEGTTREVVSGSGLAAGAGESLEQIEKVSGRLSDLIRSISQASEDQSKGSEAVARSMSEIAGITRQTAAEAREASLSIENLALLAEDLRGSVSTFRLPETNGRGTALSADQLGKEAGTAFVEQSHGAGPTVERS